jgi:HAD superfamily hydrolase (TIGR02253 family)
MAKAAIKAILFDLDNTLIDFMTMKRKCCEAAIDSMIRAGLRMERKKALKILFELYDQYGIEYQTIFQRFLKYTGKKIDYKILAHGVIAYRQVKEFYLETYSNVIPTLTALKKKYKLAIISDAPRIEAWLRLVSLKIDNFFSAVITVGDVKKKKTCATPFKAALNALKVKPEEALMVGDYIDRDIKTAKSLGIRTCYARYGVTYRNPAEAGKSGADFEINDIKDLLKLKI